MLALADVIDGQRLRTRHPIEFVATTGEEGMGDLRGAKHYFGGRGAGAAAAIALDGAGDERVIHRALGSQRYRVSFAGPGGHSWASYGVPNANHAAAVAASQIARLPLPVTPRTTLSIGRMGGGLSINSIADSAWLEIDLRSTAIDVIESVAIELARIVRAATDEENWRRTPGTPVLTSHIERIGDRPGGETPSHHPLVRAALDATVCVGREPELTLASTDANVPISLGIPAIALGAGGSGGDAHTRDEWFDNTGGTLGVARALTLLAVAAGVSHPIGY
jgi:acetylornithine deacetylase/succinyl-diaminopimelate desuccinylase-like protein